MILFYRYVQNGTTVEKEITRYSSPPSRQASSDDSDLFERNNMILYRDGVYPCIACRSTHPLDFRLLLR